MNNYQTNSLAIASAIVATNTSPLNDIVWESGKALFIFPNTQEIKVIVNRFWQKNLMVDALSYFTALKQVKSRMYEDEEYGHR